MFVGGLVCYFSKLQKKTVSQERFVLSKAQTWLWCHHNTSTFWLGYFNCLNDLFSIYRSQNPTFHLRLEFILSFFKKERNKENPILYLFPVLPFGKITMLSVLCRWFQPWKGSCHFFILVASVRGQCQCQPQQFLCFYSTKRTLGYIHFQHFYKFQSD